MIMKKQCVCLLLLAISPGWLKSQSVVTAPDAKSWTLKTQNSLYRIAVSGQGTVQMTGFGDQALEAQPQHPFLGEEVTVRGGYSTTTPVLEAIFKDRVRDIELIYERAEILQQDGYATLVIH